MSSEKHSNLGLHKWAPTDGVLRTEFNDNFGKIDEKVAGIGDVSLIPQATVVDALKDKDDKIVGVNAQLAETTSKLSNLSVDVQVDFGAKGDWDGTTGTDDTDAIQSALDFVYGKGGGTVYFPLGVYKISRPLLVKSSAPEGGYTYAPVIIKGEGNIDSKILKIGENKLYDIDATCILIKGSSLDFADAFSAIQFNNICVENGSNGALTYGLYGNKGSRLICEYASFTTSKTGLAVEARERYALYIKSAWAWSFKHCTFRGDYGFYNAENSTSLLLENTFCNTEKVAYHIVGSYSTLVNTYGDYCKGTMYEFSYANVTCVNIGAESPDCSTIIDAFNSTVMITNAMLFQSNSDTGNMFRVRGSNVRAASITAYMAAGAPKGYLWNGFSNGRLTIDYLRFTGATNKFKYMQEDNLSTSASNVKIYPDKNAYTSGLVGVLPYFDDYWDWYIETPKHPINNIYFGLQSPTINAKGDDVQWQNGGVKNAVYMNSDMEKRSVLGWARYTQTGDDLRQGTNRYIPLILNGTTANRPATWQTVGMEYFDTTLGKAVWCKTVGINEVDTLTITTGATVSGNITITLNGNPTIIPVAAGDTPEMIGDKIRATTISGWVVGGTKGSTIVTFTNNLTGINTSPTFMDTGTTGTAASFVVTNSGKNAIWVTENNTIPENKGVNVTVAISSTSLVVTFPITEADANYGVNTSPAWNTTYWITGKTTTGFTINFGTAPASASKLDWSIRR